MISLRHSVILLAFGFIAIFIQGTLLKFMSPSMVSPNLLVILVVYLGFLRVSTRGAVLAFLLGLQLDLCSAHLLGPWAGAFVITFVVIAALSQHVFVDSPIAIAVAVALSTIASSLVYSGLVYEFKPSGGISIWHLLGEALVTAVIGPILFIMIKGVLPPEDKTRGGRVTSGII